MSYACSVCGNTHPDAPALSFIYPDAYGDLTDAEQTAIAELDHDTCVIRYPEQTDRYVRAVLDLPIVGTNETFHYGVWVTLSQVNFDRYRETFKTDALDGERFTGYLGNMLPEYPESLVLKCAIVCRQAGLRPILASFLAGQESNPLVADFNHGISRERADRRLHDMLEKFD